MSEMNMFCDQCEQTAHGTGCTITGACGKSPDIESLQKILIYGLKGMAAYKHHARRLGKTDPEVEAFIEEALFATITNVNFDMGSLLAMVLKCGEMNLRTMQLLNDGHVEVMGQPAPCEITEGIEEAAPGILITGHDMIDLKALLEQTAGKGINVYTHGEMLPAHQYPELHKHPHLKGNYGGAWQDQRKEWEAFGGPIVATTNCVLIPGKNNTYLDRFYATGCTAVPGIIPIEGTDFSAVIARALEIGPLTPTETKKNMVGFHYSAILGLADKIVAAVKAGKIKRFFLVGGCDGAKPGRSWFSDFAAAAPDDTIVLTLGCGKYRIRNHDFGTIDLGDGVVIPRLLDMGQCNDAYGAIQVAVALADAFDCGVNDLPLTIALSWFEQKAVTVLLTLLHLGVKDIKIGPSLPAFVTPNVLNVLVENYNLGPIGTDGKADMAAIMAG